MGTRKFEADEPGARRYEEIRLANQRRGEPLPDKTKPGKKKSASADAVDDEVNSEV